jgi:hypothetical protein
LLFGYVVPHLAGIFSILGNAKLALLDEEALPFCAFGTLRSQSLRGVIQIWRALLVRMDG